MFRSRTHKSVWLKIGVDIYPDDQINHSDKLFIRQYIQKQPQSKKRRSAVPTQTSNNKTINQPPTNNPQWIFENQQSSTQSKHIGFVYLIINHTTRKFYIGKKTFSKYWERYTGSSTTLNKDIQQGNLISKHIIHLCSSKSELSFMELFLQISTNAFLSPNYYNEYIHIRTSTKHLHIPEDTLKQSQQTVRRIIGKIPQ